MEPSGSGSPGDAAARPAVGKVLVTGATGFIGGRLVRALSKKGIVARCIIRSAERFRQAFPDAVRAEPVAADLLEPMTLDRALRGIDLAFYLVHSMSGHTVFENRIFRNRDRLAAKNFIDAADRAGVRRIIYLGGLGEVGPNLSKHLASRQEVAEILRSGHAATTILRAANILGAGGAPFEMLRHLVERLPVILAPRWIDTRCQPIDVYDAIEYLIGCMEHPETAGEEFDIGGPEIITYRQMMEIYAGVRGLKRLIISGPHRTPRLSALFISLITPIPSGVTNPLLEGLKNEVICRDNRIRDIISIPLTPLDSSICNALIEVRAGPGKIFSRQSCFLRGNNPSMRPDIPNKDL